ncbi:hypothetical protein QEZ48_02375 [Aquamicrobium lusatiense]|uniref:hypothetical protein n=1 Tax=Aquamicrobium lusatiense TaxID=89772 RepID=UPI0024554C6C|nr:hypothetical protein [Aquamicrobium lusatiense]MDH4989675.1 hypothetical protein [Aquamicrobium lusatiense]
MVSGGVEQNAEFATFDLEVGQLLDVRLHYLPSVDSFRDQLLTVVNLSLVERWISSVSEDSGRTIASATTTPNRVVHVAPCQSSGRLLQLPKQPFDTF